MEAPDCPPYVTRSEPDNARLPHITTLAENNRLWTAYLASIDAEIEASNRQAVLS